MWRKLGVCLCLKLAFLSGWGQNAVQLNAPVDQIELLPHVQVFVDSLASFGFENIRFQTFRSLAEDPQKLDPEYVWWVRFEIQNQLSYPSKWMLYSPTIGEADIRVLSENAWTQSYRSGRYIRATEKPFNEGDFLHVPLYLEAEESVAIYMRLRELSLNPINLKPSLYERTYWHSVDQNPRGPIIIFFQGIFWIMILYNLILFFSIRFRAYLYYALYLLSISVFVSFAVGYMARSPFGDPVLLEPIGILAMGLINVCYFLFGLSFLQLAELLPRWDRLIRYYLGVKIMLLLGLQVVIAINHDISAAVQFEFVMLGIDVVLSIALFISLLRTRSRLGLYFVLGSGSVIVLGMSLAAIGHLNNLPYTFVIFLGTIVVEIIFFSLGLGFRIRQSEKEKLAAEHAKLVAQESLNEELSKINTAFGRFVPHTFLKALGHESVLDVKLGDSVEKEVTVLFADIRGYTSLAEKMSPQENFDFLNAFLGRMGPIIQKNGGFVNQYYGDGIMALFLDSPTQSLQAAQEMMAELEKYNEARQSKNRAPIRIGIGLHTGPLMMGVIGDTLRMDAGVVADTVNTAARMEGLTKHFQSGIILSVNTYQEILEVDKFPLRYLGKVQVKGRERALMVYESYAGDTKVQQQLKQQSQANFEKGLNAYFEQAFSEAAHAFDKVLKTNPIDPTARRYQALATRYLVDGIPAGWDGVERLEQK
ncbi:MAG: adenylate/guanylate cyclase domain-containing protein [Bacteroidota bacterium]